MINGMRINYELVKPGQRLHADRLNYTCLDCGAEYNKGEYTSLQDVPYTLCNRCRCGAVSWDVNEL